MRDTADEQAPRRQLESWAADRVKAWGELQKDDYDFRSWAKGASKNCLSAGAVYEYARESRKLRCLLALMNPKRPRNDWEIMRPGSIDGRVPEPGEIESYPAARLGCLARLKVWMNMRQNARLAAIFIAFVIWRIISPTISASENFFAPSETN